jgi:tryptophan synthase alpha chain
VLDLPPEESQGPNSVGARLGDGSLRRICLVAPTSPAERIAKIVQKATGFVYYVSREGVTGMQEHVTTGIGGRIELLRKQTALPICIGFGISSPEQARAVAVQADGAVVGSALVNRIAEWGKDRDLPEKLEAFARPLAQAIHS